MNDPYLQYVLQNDYSLKAYVWVVFSRKLDLETQDTKVESFEDL